MRVACEALCCIPRRRGGLRISFLRLHTSPSTFLSTCSPSWVASPRWPISAPLCKHRRRWRCVQESPQQAPDTRNKASLVLTPPNRIQQGIICHTPTFVRRESHFGGTDGICPLIIELFIRRSSSASLHPPSDLNQRRTWPTDRAVSVDSARALNGSATRPQPDSAT